MKLMCFSCCSGDLDEYDMSGGGGGVGAVATPDTSQPKIRNQVLIIIFFLLVINK